MINTWHYPTEIVFGVDSIKTLNEQCHALGIQKPFLIHDPGLNEQAWLQTIKSSRTYDVDDVFSTVSSNPTEQNVIEGLVQFRAKPYDGLIVIGGGSALDLGKTIAFMGPQTKGLWDFEDVGDNYKSANDNIVPIIAVPTTAGTGSEVGRASVILNEAAHRKVILFHPKMLPSVVISDPVLTTSLPPHLTAATGMDALAHNLEALCAPGYHPMADGIAMEGCRLVHQSLITAYQTGDNLAARADMLASAQLGATAFQKGLGAIHALSHPIGALTNAHHGLLNAIFMPYVLQFNRHAIEDKMTRLAAYLNLDNPSFDSVLQWILNLRETLQIPHTIKALNIAPQDYNAIAAMAVLDPTAATNPIPLKQEDMMRVLSDSDSG